MSPFDKLMFQNIQYPVFDGRKKIPPEGFLQTDRFPVFPDIDKYILYRILGFTLFVQISPGIMAQVCIILLKQLLKSTPVTLSDRPKKL